MADLTKLHPSLALCAKIGSILVHLEEGSSSDGHRYDFVAIASLMSDPEVSDWLTAMRSAGFLPLKRKA